MSEDPRRQGSPLSEEQRKALADLLAVVNDVDQIRVAASDVRFVIVSLSGTPTNDPNLQSELPRRAARISAGLRAAGPVHTPLLDRFDSAWSAFLKEFGPKA